MICSNCGEQYDEDDMYSLANGDCVCEDCREGDCCCCCECEELYLRCDLDSDLTCADCGGGNFDKDIDKFQSDNFGTLIKTDRRFGVELELLGDRSDVRHSIDKNFSIVEDSSICSDSLECFEVVSPILKGKKGENAIKDLCSKLEKREVKINKTCGLHAHFEALDFCVPDVTVYKYKDRKKWDTKTSGIKFLLSKTYYARLLKYSKESSKQDTTTLEILLSLFRNIYRHNFGTYRDRINIRCKQGDLIIVTDRESEINIGAKDESIVICDNNMNENFEQLKNLFAFYIACEPVLFATQPQSRREGNTYTRPISKAWNVADVYSTESIQELEKYWYKMAKRADVESAKREKYNNSRYYSVNFHSLFQKGDRNTVEIRLHSGTFNSKKILNWINLHQMIFQGVIDGKITRSIVELLDDKFLLSDKIELFFRILKLNKKVEEYFMDRIKVCTLLAKSKDKKVVGNVSRTDSIIFPF